VIGTEAKLKRRKNIKLKGPLMVTVTSLLGQAPEGPVTVILAVSLKLEKSGVSGMTA
jgi:hypothetical protein